MPENGEHQNISPPREDAKDSSRIMHFDDFLTHAGELGRYQAYVALSTMPFYLFGAFVYYSQLLMTQTGSHWCWLPALGNLSAAERRADGIPRDGSSPTGYSRCAQYVAGEAAPCRHGWEFGAEIPYPTIGSELGWVCERGSHQATAQAVFFAGSVLGLVTIGWLADRAGRLPAVVLCNLLACLGGVASTFAADLLHFSAARFFVGMACDNAMMLPYLLLLEYVAPKYKTIISNTAFAVFYTLSAVSMPWIALACGHWKKLGLATSVPMALAVVTPFILPESPRWLLSKRRVDQVVKNVETIARVNKKQIPAEVVQQFRATAATSHEDEKGSLLDLLRRPLLRKTFILLCLEHMCCDMIFDIALRTISALDYDFFISFSVVSAAQFPATMVAAFTMDWVGRRRLSNIMLLAASVCLVATAFVGHGAFSVACAVASRFCINVSYITSYQWSAELLPTPVRASGVSVIHMFGYVGTMMIQYVVYLGSWVDWLPLVAAACLAAMGGVLALGLPETMKKEMPQTFDEVEELVRTHRWLHVPRWCKPKVGLDKK